MFFLPFFYGLIILQIAQIVKLRVCYVRCPGNVFYKGFIKKGALAPRDALVIQLVQPPYDDYELFATIPFLAGYGNFTASDSGMVEIVVDFDLRHCFFLPLFYGLIISLSAVFVNRFVCKALMKLLARALVFTM